MNLRRMRRRKPPGPDMALLQKEFPFFRTGRMSTFSSEIEFPSMEVRPVYTKVRTRPHGRKALRHQRTLSVRLAGQPIERQHTLIAARIRTQSIPHGPVATLAFVPHAQQGRVPCIDEVDDPYIGLAGMFAM